MGPWRSLRLPGCGTALRALAQQILSLCSARPELKRKGKNGGQGDPRDVPPVAGQPIPSMGAGAFVQLPAAEHGVGVSAHLLVYQNITIPWTNQRLSAQASAPSPELLQVIELACK